MLLLQAKLKKMEKDTQNIIQELEASDYKYGFVSDIETETIGRGLNEDVIRLISQKKGEPEWMLERRLKAYRHWLTLEHPTWAHLDIPEIDFQDVIYYAAPKPKKQLNSMDEVDPELKRTFDKLGIPLEEQMALAGVAVDAVMDSVSVKTTFRDTLAEKGIIFCSISEAIKEHPELIKKYLGSVVPYTDNFYAALNAAVFSDGSFCYIPKGVRCPMELSTYFRINAEGTGQFERTLIVADEGSYVSYLEGCTAPRRTSCTLPLWRLSWSEMPMLSTLPYRTGTQAIRRVRAVSITSLRSAVSAVRVRTSRGHRSRRARLSHGSIPAAFWRAITRRASSTPWP